MKLRHPLCLVVACLLLTVSGCAKWRTASFDLNKLRDPRAVDIDSRLSSPPPVQTFPAG